VVSRLKGLFFSTNAAFNGRIVESATRRRRAKGFSYPSRSAREGSRAGSKGLDQIERPLEGKNQLSEPTGM
jgi:hypothetical protein